MCMMYRVCWLLPVPLKKHQIWGFRRHMHWDRPQVMALKDPWVHAHVDARTPILLEGRHGRRTLLRLLLHLFTMWSEPTLSNQIRYFPLGFGHVPFFWTSFMGMQLKARPKTWKSLIQDISIFEKPLFSQETSHTRRALWLLRLLTSTSVILPYHICWLVNQTIEILQATRGWRFTFGRAVKL